MLAPVDHDPPGHWLVLASVVDVRADPEHELPDAAEAPAPPGPLPEPPAVDAPPPAALEPPPPPAAPPPEKLTDGNAGMPRLSTAADEHGSGTMTEKLSDGALDVPWLDPEEPPVALTPVPPGKDAAGELWGPGVAAIASLVNSMNTGTNKSTRAVRTRLAAVMIEDAASGD